MDFDNTTIEVVFQPSTINEEQVQTVILLEDNFNEDIEGFYIVVQVDAARSSPTDVNNTELVRNGVALVRITDNDSKFVILQLQCSNHSIYEATNEN